MSHLVKPTADARALAARFAARVAEDGEADVAYAVVDSPLGRLVAARTRRGLARIAYEDSGGGLDAILEALASRLSPRVVEAPGRLDEARRQLDDFFGGRRRAFALPLDLGMTRGFSRRVLEATTRIPFGETRTYAQVAAQAGSPAANRAAGNALGANPVPIVVPCHRVLRTGGGLGGYTGGLPRKERLLAVEGVSPDRDGGTASPGSGPKAVGQDRALRDQQAGRNWRRTWSSRTSSTGPDWL